MNVMDESMEDIFVVIGAIIAVIAIAAIAFVSAAIQGFCDALEYYPNSISKAALAIDYIANFHPFVEGNKRTAFEVAVALLRKGGLELNDDDETFNFIKDVAWGKYDREDIEVWLRCNTHLSNL